MASRKFKSDEAYLDEDYFNEIIDLLAEDETAPTPKSKRKEHKPSPALHAQSITAVKRKQSVVTTTTKCMVDKKGHTKKTRKGITLCAISKSIHDHLKKYGKYNIHTDTDKVFQQIENHKKPDLRRIYDAVRWLESFGLARRGSFDRSTVFPICDDKSTFERH